MIEEKKYREVFKAQKRWAKSKGNFNRHVAGNTHFMIEPAQKTYNKILELEEIKNISNYERLNLLIDFYKQQNIEEESKANKEQRMWNHYYWDRIQEVEYYIMKIKAGEEIIINRISR